MRQAELIITRKVWNMVLAAGEDEKKRIARDICAMAGSFGLSVPVKIYVYSTSMTKPPPVGELHPDMTIKVLEAR